MKMKRDFYKVLSYDGTIEKKYYNYKSAYNYCNKLIANNIDCGIYKLNQNTWKYEIIIGC